MVRFLFLGRFVLILELKLFDDLAHVFPAKLKFVRLEARRRRRQHARPRHNVRKSPQCYEYAVAEPTDLNRPRSLSGKRFGSVPHYTWSRVEIIRNELVVAIDARVRQVKSDYSTLVYRIAP